jgi:hypothetical protein
MQIGDLVLLIHPTYGGIGIIINTHEPNPQVQEHLNLMLTVHWFDGMGVGIYWNDELEVLCKSEI